MFESCQISGPRYIPMYSVILYAHIFTVLYVEMKKKNIEEKNSTLTALARKRRAEKHVKSNTSTRVYIYICRVLALCRSPVVCYAVR